MQERYLLKSQAENLSSACAYLSDINKELNEKESRW